jgi:hypothetical protein
LKTQTVRILTIVLLIGATARSEEKTRASGFELKNRSEFKSTAVKRDPFWPIGFVKPSDSPNVGADPTADFRPENFKLTSVMLGDPALVVLNGVEFAEGEVKPVRVGLQKLNITLLNVMDGAVRLQHRGQIIVVELKRK